MVQKSQPPLRRIFVDRFKSLYESTNLRTSFLMLGPEKVDPIVHNQLVIEQLLLQLQKGPNKLAIDVNAILQRLQRFNKTLNILNDPLDTVLHYQSTQNTSNYSKITHQKHNNTQYDIKQVTQTATDDDYPIHPTDAPPKRSEKSVQTLLYRAVELLLSQRGGLTREQLCTQLQVDKRRMSAALSTTTAVGLLIEPENCRPGTIDRPLARLRMPGLSLVRNLRLEAMCTDIIGFEQFYKTLVELREAMEQFTGQRAPDPGLGFVGRRIDALARAAPTMQPMEGNGAIPALPTAPLLLTLSTGGSTSFGSTEVLSAFPPRSGPA